MTTDQQAPLGVFGGSGFYEFLDGAQEIVVDTPYGPPAGPVVVGTVARNAVAFMARHGRGHEFAAHRVPYRANMWAMHYVGVRSIVTPCSVGSLQPDIHPGQLVVIDQVVEAEDLRDELLLRLRYAARRDRHFATKRRGVPPV